MLAICTVFEPPFNWLNLAGSLMYRTIGPAEYVALVLPTWWQTSLIWCGVAAAAHLLRLPVHLWKRRRGSGSPSREPLAA